MTGLLQRLENALAAFGRYCVTPKAEPRLAVPPRPGKPDAWRGELRRRLDTTRHYENHLERMLAEARAPQPARVFTYYGERVTREEFISLCEQALADERERRRRWNEGEEYLEAELRP